MVIEFKANGIIRHVMVDDDYFKFMLDEKMIKKNRFGVYVYKSNNIDNINKIIKLIKE